MLILSSLLSGQNEELGPCGFDPSPFEVELINAGFDKFHSEQHSFSKLGEMDTLVFPIRITIFREDNGEMPTRSGTDGVDISQADITTVLDNINEIYAPIKIKFLQEGPISYIDVTIQGGERATYTPDYPE